MTLLGGDGVTGGCQEGNSIDAVKLGLGWGGARL